MAFSGSLFSSLAIRAEMRSASVSKYPAGTSASDPEFNSSTTTREIIFPIIFQNIHQAL